MKLSPHEIAYVAAKYWSGNDLLIAVAVALAESGGDTDALGRSESGASIGNRDHGLWQISGRWHGDKIAKVSPTPVFFKSWRNPYVNADLAHQVFTERANATQSGWTAWATFNSGAYEKYMADAQIAVANPFAPQLN